MNLGRWEIDDFLTFTCNTHDPETGAATDADAVPSYRVYEDETGTPILTGSMALLDSANTAGFYSERIQLTAASGFETGKTYTIYISATVNSTEGTISHSFQVEAALATAADLATVDANVDAILVDTGTTLPATLTTIEGKIDTVDTVVDGIKAVTDNLPDGGALTTIDANIDAILVDTGTDIPASIAALNDLSSADVQTVLENNDLDHLAKVAHPTGDPVVNTLFDYLMNKDGSQTFDRTSDSLEALGEGGGASPAAIADAVWDELASGHVTAGSFGDKLQNKVPSATIDDYKADVSALALEASVQTIDGNVDLILADTNELQTDWADGGRLDLILDGIKAVTDQLPDGGALTTIDSNIDAILVDTGTTIPATLATLATQASVDTIDANVDAILVDTGTDIPAAIAALNDPSAADIADAVWDEALADHTTITTFGYSNQNQVPSETLNDYKADVSALATAANLAIVDSNVDAIVAKLPTNYIMGSSDQTDKDDEIDAIKAKTDNLPADPAATSDITALNDLSAADIQTVLENNDLDHLAKVAHPTGIPTADSLFDLAFSKDAGQTFNRATDSLEALRDENYEGPSLSQIVDGVWDELASGHVTAGSFGDKLQNKIPSATIGDYQADISGLATAANLATLDGKVDTVDTVVDAIKAVTDNLPNSGQLLDLSLIRAKTDNLPADPAQESSITALNDLSSADVQTVIENNDLDHLAKVAHPSGDPVANTLFDYIMNKDGSQTFDRSTDSLEAIYEATGGAAPTAGEIADAVWDEAISGHTGAGTFGAKNQNLVPSETIGDYKADVSGLASQASVDTIDGIVDAIKLVTDNLPDSGQLLDLAAIKAVTDLLPDGGALTTIDANIDSILEDTGTTIPATLAGLATAAALATVDGNVDAILVDTGTTIPGTIAALQSDVTDVLTDTGDIIADVAAVDGNVDDLTADVADVKTDTESILAAVGGGPPAGAIPYEYNITNQVSGQPIADVDVWVTTDEPGVNVVASGRTDDFGNVTFYLDAGTYYFWSQKAGFNFDNPDTEVVS